MNLKKLVFGLSESDTSFKGIKPFLRFVSELNNNSNVLCGSRIQKGARTTNVFSRFMSMTDNLAGFIANTNKPVSAYSGVGFDTKSVLYKLL